MPYSPNEELPFKGRQRQASDAARDANWEAIAQRLHHQHLLPLPRRHYWVRWTSAAAALLLLAFAAWKVLGPGAYTTISTAYGQTRRIVLPDQSIVVLNGNSSLKWPANWNNANGRNVWLEGEGYFEIAKNNQPNMARFVVHTSSVQVTVLGTKFNVNAYSGQAVVALKEGTVALQYTSGKKAETLTMAPGQVVSIQPTKDDEKPLILTDTVASEMVAEWTSNTYHFAETPLQEIATRILQQHGYTMQFENEELARRSMNGHLHASSLDELLYAIEVTLNVKITKNDIEKTLTVALKQ
jgi:ferric-dicitrate binding protein FerR (iron transport regulator)